jgi:carbamoyl-phosphate synthase large subunit
MVAPPEVIATCQDKIGFVNFCQGHGFSVPLTYTLEEVRTKNPYPVFVRPRVGKGSRGAAIARHGADLDRMATDHQDLLIQEYIEAPEYTIDLFADFDGQVISAVPRERVSVFGGESFITTTRKDDRLIAEAVRLAECLGLVGHNTIQCFKRDGGRVTFIEVNPRFGGAAHLGFQAGAPSPRFLIKLMNGQKLDPCLGLFQDNLTMLRYSEDLFLSGDDLIKMRDPA